VRRSAVLALVTAGATAGILAFAVPPAAAHICPLADQIPVAQSSTIDVGVTVEGEPVPDVSITIPAGLRLDQVDAKAGWDITRTGASLRYRGGPIAAFTCEYFSLRVTAPGKGSFGISVVQRTATGTVVARSTPDPANANDRLQGQIVYAGVKPPAVATGSGGLSTATILGIALVGFGVVMVAGLLFRNRRDRRLYDAEDRDAEDRDSEDRDSELRARLERFKNRTPDPPGR
jgi:uncharacterized protein YcnI